MTKRYPFRRPFCSCNPRNPRHFQRIPLRVLQPPDGPHHSRLHLYEPSRLRRPCCHRLRRHVHHAHFAPLPVMRELRHSRLDHILPQQHRYPLPRRNLVPVRGHHQKTIRLCQRRNVSRSLPFQSLHFRRPSAPLYPRRQKVCQPQFLTQRFSQPRFHQRQRPSLRPVQQIDRRRHEQFERYHRRNRVPRQPKHRLPLAHPEHCRLPRPNRHCIKVKLRSHGLQNFFHQVILPHRNAT